MRSQADEIELKKLRDIVNQVDDVLIVNWIVVKDNNYKKALNDLIAFNTEIEKHFEIESLINA